MTRQLTIVYSEDILKRGVRRFWIRFINWHGFAAIGVAVGGFLYFLLAGDRSWLLGIFGILAGLLVLMPVLLYLTYLRRGLAKFSKMNSKSVEITLTEADFTTKSDLGTSSVPWTSFQKLWRYPDVWLLFYDRNAFITLPAGQLDEEVKAMLVEQVCGSGGKVV